MTPAARAAAAIAVLDRWLAGTPAEQALTNWGRASRYAGSGDRAAVRDLVFQAIRCRRSLAHRGGADTGRGLILGLLRQSQEDPATVFTGQGHAPAPLSAAEAADPGPATGLAALDCPDWLAPALRASLGDLFVPVMAALQRRAPVFLRVNTARSTRAEATAALAPDGIEVEPHPLAATALLVTRGARRVQASRAYAEGLVDLQDAASQAVALAVPLAPGDRVLDLCAGGGGKALALAARGARVTASDADPARMRDLPARAARAGAIIDIASPDRLRGLFDVVLADAPCSGSGAWRRSPEGKWALTPGRLDSLRALQRDVLDAAAARLRPGGTLAYATCSLLDQENAEQADACLARHPDLRDAGRLTLTPCDGGDGFFLALLRREP
jgi:16S rRNA (cytosine967-C5)-methyltransferase